MSATAEERPPDTHAAAERRHPVGRGGVLTPEQHPTVARDGRCQRGIPLPGDLSTIGELQVETGIVGLGLVPNRRPDAQPAYSVSGNPDPYKRLAIRHRTSVQARQDRSFFIAREQDQ
jgi:hypothetical protein